MGRPYSIQKRIDKFFSYRPRSTKETSDYLTLKLKLDEDGVSKELQKLTLAGLLDDLAFARWWVMQRTANRPKSRSYIRQELLQKGISDESISAVFEGEDVSDDDTLRHLAQKKFPSFKKRFTEDEYASKLVTYLIRRGYLYTEAKKAVEECQSSE